MTVTPYDFHRMIGLQFDGIPINLKDKLGVRLGVDLLGRRYATEMIHYNDLEANFRHYP